MSNIIHPTEKELDLLRMVRNLQPYQKMDIKLNNNEYGNVSILLTSITKMEMVLDKD